MLHPDRSQQPTTAQQFQLINEAYQVLRVPQLRLNYDRVGFHQAQNPVVMLENANLSMPDGVTIVDIGGGISIEPMYTQPMVNFSNTVMYIYTDSNEHLFTLEPITSINSDNYLSNINFENSFVPDNIDINQSPYNYFLNSDAAAYIHHQTERTSFNNFQEEISPINIGVSAVGSIFMMMGLAGMLSYRNRLLRPQPPFFQIPRQVPNAKPDDSPEHTRFLEAGFTDDDISEEKAHLICPLSMQLFSEPVECKEKGLHPVEKDWIIYHLRTNGPTNPFNRMFLTVSELKPCTELKEEVTTFVDEMIENKQGIAFK